MVPAPHFHPKDEPRGQGGAAPTVLTVGSADPWGAAAGPRHRVTGPAVLTAAREAAVLPEGVRVLSVYDSPIKTKYLTQMQAELTLFYDRVVGPQKDPALRNPSRDTDTLLGVKPPVQKELPRAAPKGTCAPGPRPHVWQTSLINPASSPSELQQVHLLNQHFQSLWPLGLEGRWAGSGHALDRGWERAVFKCASAAHLLCGLRKSPVPPETLA